MANNYNDQMHVTKRNGSMELVSFDKITKRVENLCNNIKPKLNINYGQLVMKIIDQLFSVFLLHKLTNF